MRALIAGGFERDGLEFEAGRADLGCAQGDRALRMQRVFHVHVHGRRICGGLEQRQVLAIDVALDIDRGPFAGDVEFSVGTPSRARHPVVERFDVEFRRDVHRLPSLACHAHRAAAAAYIQIA